jgi:hypothetical protein
MRTAFRLLAMIVLLGGLSCWFLLGAHRGWTKNQVPVQHTDEITSISYVTYEQRFVPGIDFLLASIGLAGGLGVASFFFNRNPPNSLS